MKIGLKYKGKKVEIDLKKCNCFEKGIGLMFSRRQKARALLFEFKKPTREAIHSLFVFFDFVAIWLDDKNKILELRVVKPFNFCVRPEKPFIKIVEIPINKNYEREVKLLYPQSFS